MPLLVADIHTVQRYQRIDDRRLRVATKRETARPRELASGHTHLDRGAERRARRAPRRQTVALSVKATSPRILTPSGVMLSTVFGEQYSKQLVRAAVLAQLNELTGDLVVDVGHRLVVQNAEKVLRRNN